MERSVVVELSDRYREASDPTRAVAAGAGCIVGVAGAKRVEPRRLALNPPKSEERDWTVGLRDDMSLLRDEVS